jgi:hypothetical protein
MITSPNVMNIPSYAPCQYYHWDNDLHVFCFTLPSRDAVDAWLSNLTTIYAQNDKRIPILQLLDIRQSGMLPMTYVFNKLQTWIPHHQGSPILYSAVLHNDSAAASMVQPFIRLLGVEKAYKFHFFSAHAQEHAINWLLNQQISTKVS